MYMDGIEDLLHTVPRDVIVIVIVGVSRVQADHGWRRGGRGEVGRWGGGEVRKMEGEEDGR
jgi:hypothetical protein